MCILHLVRVSVLLPSAPVKLSQCLVGENEAMRKVVNQPQLQQLLNSAAMCETMAADQLHEHTNIALHPPQGCAAQTNTSTKANHHKYKPRRHRHAHRQPTQPEGARKGAVPTASKRIGRSLARTDLNRTANAGAIQHDEALHGRDLALQQESSVLDVMVCLCVFHLGEALAWS